jgi:mannose-6-phosphate isomerase
MAELFKLRNQIKHYQWGSPEWIPRLMGTPNQDGRPWAELWMGSHPGAPSLIETGRPLDAGEPSSLGELIARNPAYCLGETGAKQYGALPFLFKLLAAEKPLSIQAHPNRAQAREGFERENRAGLALDAPGRNYRDPNHKPEIICALSPFTGMCGFRKPAEIKGLLAAFLSPPEAGTSLVKGFAPLIKALDAESTAAALRNFLAALFDLSAGLRAELTAYILGAKNSGGVSTAQWELMRRFAELYGGDPALIAPLYLNLFSLAPGEAVFLRAGVPHAYIHGFGIELMANSDNVLRGGLSPKHVDVPELLRILDFSPLRPEIFMAPPEDSDGGACFTYPAPCGEFALTVMRGGGGERTLAPAGAAICVVTQGEVLISGEHERVTLKSGESVFIPAGLWAARPPEFRGNFTLYAASLPGP